LGEVWSVRANECYRVLKRELKPWLKEHGYHYTPRLVCSWYKKLEDKFLIIIASHNKGGGDNYILAWNFESMSNLTKPQIEITS
jgi:hypothetical protein